MWIGLDLVRSTGNLSSFCNNLIQIYEDTNIHVSNECEQLTGLRSSKIYVFEQLELQGRLCVAVTVVTDTGSVQWNIIQ